MSAPKSALVKLRGVSAGYDGRTVLSNVSLDVYDDDFLVVTGPNGGGKTTLVKIITGLLPYSGLVEYADSLTVNRGLDGRLKGSLGRSGAGSEAGVDLGFEGGAGAGTGVCVSAGAGIRGFGVRRIGYLPQQSLFDRSFPISVVDVVVSGLQGERGFRRRYMRDDFARARKLLKMTGISAIERRPVGEISGGQMQRALLCRALIAAPRLLILDEPATYVDSGFESELYDILRELHNGLNCCLLGGGGESTESRSEKVACDMLSGDPEFRGGKMAIVMVSHDEAAVSSMATGVVHVDGTVVRR
ncbi:MAG: metal ABC transporter ATP-binding protein [Alistipes sp.]|jgi:zinc transport system ATP-binding protein|nr:metal ABC transporter ATP-binding protein [Alistipes sp.]